VFWVIIVVMSLVLQLGGESIVVVAFAHMLATTTSILIALMLAESASMLMHGFGMKRKWGVVLGGGVRWLVGIS